MDLWCYLEGIREDVADLALSRVDCPFFPTDEERISSDAVFAYCNWNMLAAEVREELCAGFELLED